MAGKSPVTATEEQRTALKVLAQGADRAEADRARALRRRSTAGPARGSRKPSGCARIRFGFGVAILSGAGSLP